MSNVFAQEKGEVNLLKDGIVFVAWASMSVATAIKVLSVMRWLGITTPGFAAKFFGN